MIKAVILDWGGVVSPAGTPDEVPAALAEALSISAEQATTLLKETSQELKRGKLTDDGFWSKVESSVGVKVAEQDRNIWTPQEFFRPDARILAYTKKLQAKGIPVAILSNTFPVTAQQIKDAGWYDNFDPVFISTDAGFAKPDPEFYELCLSSLGLTGKEVVFVDDQQYCLDAAKEHDMNTILASSTDQILTELDQLLS